MINKFFKFLCTGLLCAAIVCSQIPFVFAEESSAETGNWDTYSDTWALTDALGRTAADASTAGGVRGNKKVGMFYFVWHNELMEIENGAYKALYNAQFKSSAKKDDAPSVIPSGQCGM